MARSVKTFTAEFVEYLKISYPEHARKILSSRINANLSRFFYPFFSFTIPAFIFGTLVLILYSLRDALVTSMQGSKLSEFINQHTVEYLINIVFTVGSSIALFSFILGLIAGFSNARKILFQAEELEINLRHIWLLEGKNSASLTHKLNSSTEQKIYKRPFSNSNGKSADYEPEI